MKPDPKRREFVLASTAALASLALPGAATAQVVRLDPVPTVDGVTIRVITDSSYDTPRVGTSKWVKVKRAGLGTPADFRKTLHNEWGLALALESRRGGDTRQILLDFGWTPAALLNNMELIGVEAAKTQALVVSHGHFDHYGGMLGFLEKHRDKLPADLTLYVGGEDVFCRRKASRAPGAHLTDSGWLDRRELEKLRVRVVTCEKPTPILGHAFTTRHIARSSFETIFPTQLVEYFVGENLAVAQIPRTAEIEVRRRDIDARGAHHFQRLGRDLRPDSVATNDCNSMCHKACTVSPATQPSEMDLSAQKAAVAVAGPADRLFAHPSAKFDHRVGDGLGDRKSVV